MKLFAFLQSVRVVYLSALSALLAWWARSVRPWDRHRAAAFVRAVTDRPAAVAAVGVVVGAALCAWGEIPLTAHWAGVLVAVALLAAVLSRFASGVAPRALAQASAWLAVGILASAAPDPPPKLPPHSPPEPLVVRAEGPSQATGDGWRFPALVRAAPDGSGPHAALVVGQGPPPAVSVGEVIAIRGQWLSPEPARNPADSTPKSVARVRLAAGSTLVRYGPTQPSTRDSLRPQIRAALKGRARALAEALLLGDGGALAAADRAHFDRTGTSHLLAVSGLHLAWAAAAVYYLTLFVGWRFGRRGWTELGRTHVFASIGAVVAAMGVVALTGAHAATVRACVMLTIVVGARLVRRPPDATSTLSVALLVVLVAGREPLSSPGLHLSFSAVAALLVWLHAPAPELDADARLRAKWLRRWSRPGDVSRSRRFLASAVAILRTSLTTSFVAHGATAPWTAAHFGVVAWGAAWCNAVLVPLFALLVLPPLVLLVCGLQLGGSAAELAGQFFTVATDLWFALLQRFEPVGWQGPVASVDRVGALCLTAAWLSCVWGVRSRAAVPILAGLCLAALVAGIHVGRHAGASGMQIVTVDVGHGDAGVVNTAHGAFLIDGGGHGGPGGERIGRSTVGPVLRSLGVSRLDAMVVTHPDADHVAGLLTVARMTPVEVLYAPKPREAVPLELALFAEAIMRGTTVRWLEAGQTWFWAGAHVDVLAPPRDAPDDWSRNARSAVLAVRWGHFDSLWLGDAEVATERWLTETAGLARFEWVKVAHHGSRTSSDPEFIHAVAPALAVVSASEHARYRLPHADVLQRWVDVGAEIWRTDWQGALRVWTDGMVWVHGPAR